MLLSSLALWYIKLYLLAVCNTTYIITLLQLLMTQLLCTFRNNNLNKPFKQWITRIYRNLLIAYQSYRNLTIYQSFVLLDLSIHPSWFVCRTDGVNLKMIRISIIYMRGPLKWVIRRTNNNLQMLWQVIPKVGCRINWWNSC